MTSQPWTSTIAIHILFSISKTKGNQAINFTLLIEYNMTNNFFDKSCTKYGRKTIPRPFFKKSNLNISLNL